MRFILVCLFLSSIVSATSLSLPAEDDFLFETARLKAYAATADRITAIAGLLNQTDGDGRLNGRYY